MEKCSAPPAPVKPPLLRITFRHVCLGAIVPPLGAIFAVFLLGFWLHSDALTDYEWMCGPALLPSASRVLNQPAERTLWNIAIALHFPLRPLITLHYFPQMRTFAESDFGAKDSVHSLLVKLMHVLFFLSGIADPICLVGLSLVGERENAELHVFMFSTFLFVSFVHFTLHSLLRTTKSKSAGQRMRKVLLALLCLLVPVVIVCFALHQLYCLEHSYTLFVLSEYLTIFIIFAFNSAMFLDNHQRCGYSFVKRSLKK